jgi:hypothetical protein
MKKVVIKNLNGVQIAGAEMLDPTDWIAQCVSVNCWGLPERWNPEFIDMQTTPLVSRYDSADVIETLEDVKTIDGQLISTKTVKLRAQYTIDITDITYEYELDLCIQQRIAEYPQIGEFLNAFFDGGQAALEELHVKRLATKAKYPKPNVE